MNWAATRLATKRALQWVVQNKRVLSPPPLPPEKCRTKKLKDWIVSGKDSFHKGKEGSYRADYLISVHQETPLLGESETAIRLVIKFWFGDMA